LLTINILIFFIENQLAATVQFPAGVPIAAIVATYAETIDTAAWVVLLFMFEMETSYFHDVPGDARLKKTLQAIRVFCYALIVYAFYGYLERAIADTNAVNPKQFLLWLDVTNAATWLLVVFILEIEVRLLERGRLDGMASRTSNVLKTVLYSILAFAAIYWGIKDDFIDFWDAFLWLLAFVFIELNVFGWHRLTETITESGSACR
jgi:hypothetical protein